MERTPASRPARRQDPVLLAAGAVLLAAAAVFAVVMAADRARPPTASLDRWWLSVVTTWQSAPLTRAGEVLSYVAGPWGGTVVVAVLVVPLLWRRRFGAAVFLALAEACGSGASQLIKHLVQRPRPPHPLVRADFGSFPSGHVITTVVVGLAVVAALGRPGRRKLPLAGVAAAAVLMMCCRTYLRAHWLSDTFESVLVASGLVLVLWALFTPVLHATSVTSALVNPAIPGLSPKVATKEDIMAAAEGFVEVPGGRVWYRIVGGSEDAVPLLCLHGGPGFTHYYLEPLEALAEHRRVIFYDQLGCGRSDRPDDLSLWTVDRFVEELAQVREALHLDRLHLFGSSWGGMLAMQYVLDRQGERPDLVSLTLCGSPASMIRWVADCEELLAEETPETRRVIREHEASGFTACPEYQAAILGFYRKHVCRLDPWPPGLERSYAEAGFGVYTTMNGPSEFTVTGTLKTWDIMDRLPEITVPALLVGGRYDECTPGHMADMHARIAGSELVTIEDASHLCFAEQPAEFNRVINGFLDRTEHGPRS